MKEILLELLAQRKLLQESITENRYDHSTKIEALKYFDACYREVLLKYLDNESTSNSK